MSEKVTFGQLRSQRSFNPKNLKLALKKSLAQLKFMFFKEGYGVFSVINGDVYKGNFK